MSIVSARWTTEAKDVVTVALDTGVELSFRHPPPDDPEVAWNPHSRVLEASGVVIEDPLPTVAQEDDVGNNRLVKVARRRARKNGTKASDELLALVDADP